MGCVQRIARQYFRCMLPLQLVKDCVRDSLGSIYWLPAESSDLERFLRQYECPAGTYVLPCKPDPELLEIFSHPVALMLLISATMKRALWEPAFGSCDKHDRILTNSQRTTSAPSALSR